MDVSDWKLLPVPTFGKTLAITVRSSVARQMSRQPMSQRGCLRSMIAQARSSGSDGPSRRKSRSSQVSGVSACISSPLAPASQTVNGFSTIRYQSRS